MLLWLDVWENHPSLSVYLSPQSVASPKQVLDHRTNEKRGEDKCISAQTDTPLTYFALRKEWEMRDESI